MCCFILLFLRCHLSKISYDTRLPHPTLAGAYEGVAAVGAFQGSLSVDGISGLSAPAAGNSAGFAVYLNADGRPVWSRAFACGTNDAGDAAVEGVVMSTDLAITVVGTFTCTNLTVGPVTLERQHPSATASVFAARFGSDGTYHWAKVVNSAVAVGPKGADIAIDSDGNVYAAAIAKGLVVDGTGQQVSAVRITVKWGGGRWGQSTQRETRSAPRRAGFGRGKHLCFVVHV